ncbi:hypothetical protein BG846_03122 [Streptomyces fradiae ATCC 10745 = DSM 40063]|uniref:Uncharacterized protein n=1 Tax=Streptomyces fradiae ATCC 10745 = DSM 40063 TaxID=1319510 RepID=A0A1Y2NVL2_STRFR|nr:hypothetical protein BG846_03122 [Streptomyces fradiae ATCC 10745 = DSM 40063]
MRGGGCAEAGLVGIGCDAGVLRKGAVARNTRTARRIGGRDPAGPGRGTSRHSASRPPDGGARQEAARPCGATPDSVAGKGGDDGPRREFGVPGCPGVRITSSFRVSGEGRPADAGRWIRGCPARTRRDIPVNDFGAPIGKPLGYPRRVRGAGRRGPGPDAGRTARRAAPARRAPPPRSRGAGRCGGAAPPLRSRPPRAGGRLRTPRHGLWPAVLQVRPPVRRPSARPHPRRSSPARRRCGRFPAGRDGGTQARPRARPGTRRRRHGERRRASARQVGKRAAPALRGGHGKPGGAVP